MDRFARPGAWMAGLALVAGLAGCRGRSEPPHRRAPAPPTLAAALPAPRPVAVTEIALGNRLLADKRVAEEADRFGPHDTVYAVVSTEGQAARAVLVARWTYRTGQLVDSTAQSIAPKGPAVTEFHISRRDPWRPGAYQVEILLDSVRAGVRYFQIED
jgi:hypothetical protein